MNLYKYNPVRKFQTIPCSLFHQIATNGFLPNQSTATNGRTLKLLAILASLWMVSACDPDCNGNNSWDECHNPESEGEWQRIEYAGKQSTAQFNDGSWGEHLYYFPAFGRTNSKDGLHTNDKSTVEVNRDFEKLVHLDDVSKDFDLFDNRTFSFDDTVDKDLVGTKTAGGYGWPEFYLPVDENGNDRTGQSGVVYDPKTRDSFNNIVNQLKIKTEGLHAFCLNIVTDNTDGKYDPNVDIIARGDYKLADTKVPRKYLTFDGIPDVYTFKYTGFNAGDRIKLRIKADKFKKFGGGLAGIMVSNIHSCCEESCGIENECGGDNGCGQPCDCTKGELHANNIDPSVLSDFGNLQNEQGYYIRGLYTRQVLTLDINSSSLVMRPRRNTANQQWVFAGSCDSDSACEGYFVNKQSMECLSFDAASSKAQISPAPCLDEKFQWVLKVEGEDAVTGGEPFEASNGASKYSIRHKLSTDGYLVAKATEKEAAAAEKSLAEQDPDDIDKEKLEEVAKGEVVGVEPRTNPNRPWDHWVFEYQVDGEEIVSE